MAVVKFIEISASSPNSFDAAAAAGIEKASQTVKNIRSAWVNEQKVMVDNGKISEYRVNLRVGFELQ